MQYRLSYFIAILFVPDEYKVISSSGNVTVISGSDNNLIKAKANFPKLSNLYL